VIPQKVVFLSEHDRNQPQLVEIIPPTEIGLQQWQPSIGEETMALLDHLRLPADSRQTLMEEAALILSKGVPLNGPEGQQTGLVVGYVQSGKTMSFTTVAALARDNGYQMVIVIAGTSKPLFDQSTERLESDLRLNARPDRKWLHIANPRVGDASNISGKFEDWQDSDATDDEKQTVLITVMKHHAQLQHLTDTLAATNLQGVRALVIDDEADQAGLNTRVQLGEESTTYSRLLALRSQLPHHTFLQYTATPQAPLLINMIDQLSPRFADVLTPGVDYVGGKEFFIEDPGLVESIPSIEIPTRSVPLTAPPDTFLKALRIFFVGVAAGVIRDGSSGNRSMLVHPSQETMRHAQYFDWARSAKETWVGVLELDEHDPDRIDLIEDFRKAYLDLESTVANIPAFEDLTAKLKRAIRNTLVTEVNAAKGKTPNIDWKANYAHIIVGGQAMDRGFTVEGLTVTYMPRTIGVGNSDTIQQRARFFGYKRRYLGYCRVFLEPTAKVSYRRYVEHEEDIRSRLQIHQQTGQPLTEWKRAFVLTKALKPTRDSVLDLDYMKGQFSDGWYAPKAPHDSSEATASNRQVVADFRQTLQLHEDIGDASRTQVQRHLIDANVPVRRILEELLIPFRATFSRDSRQLTGVLIQIQKYIEDQDENIGSVYIMSGGIARKRVLNSEGEIPQLFQGSNSKGGVVIYPGDREIHAGGLLTVQIHNVDVETAEGTLENVPALAIWIPGCMSAEWYVQQEVHGGQ
jgi:hypothetical protein